MNTKKTYLYVTFAVCIIVIVSLWGGYLSNYKRLMTENSDLLKAEVMTSANLLQSKIDEAKVDIFFLHSVPPIQGIVRAKQNNGIDPKDGSSLEIWRDRLGAIFSAYIDAHDDVFQVRYIGVQDGGLEIVRVDRTQDGIFVVPDKKLQKKGERDYFQQVTQDSFEGVYVSEINLNREFGDVQTPHKPTMRVGIKVLEENGDVFGVILINVAVYDYFELIQSRLPQKDMLYVINGDGDFIYHPNRDLTFGFDLNNRVLWDQEFEYKKDINNDDVKLYSNKEVDYLVAAHKIHLIRGQHHLNIWVTRNVHKIQFEALTHTAYFSIAFVAALILLLIYAVLYRKNLKHQNQLNFEKARNSSIVESSQDAIIGVSMDGIITDWNPGAVDLFGYEKSEVIGKHTNEVILTADTIDDENMIRREIQAGHFIKPFETLRTTKNKGAIHVSVSASPIRNESGEVVGVSKIVRDITEQKKITNKIEELNRSLEQQVEQRTAQLIKSHSLQTAILENAANTIIATDCDGIITHFSPAAEALLGYSAEEMIGKNSPALFHLESEVIDRAKSLSEELNIELTPGFDVFVIKTNMNMRNESEWTYVTKTGKKIPIYLSVSALRDEDGHITGYLGMAIDISELVISRRKLESIRDQLSRACEVASLGIWSWEPNTDVLEWNPQMFSIYDMQAGEPTNLHLWLKFVADEDRERVNTYFNNLDSNCGDSDIVFDIVTSAGFRKTIQASASLEHNYITGASTVIGINRDITKQINYEKALKNAKETADSASKAKSEFVANMSHEIRTPMNAIIGLLQLLRKTSLNPKQEDYVTKSDSAAKTLLHILDDILDFSRVEAGKLEIDSHPFRINDLVENSYSVLSANIGDKDVKLVFDIDPAIPSFITLDSFRLQQIIVNLAGNAIKFTESGVVSITLTLKADANNVLKCSIKDTGIGIAPDKQAKIFDAFSQAETSMVRNYGGTGLGLAITKRLIDLMNGTITLRSEPNVGTTFTFEIPFEDNSLNAKEEQHRDTEYNNITPPITQRPIIGRRLQNISILLVEDNQINQLVAKEILEAEGALVHVADNGQSALDALKEQDKGYFDVVLMDIQMPIMDGYTATRIIRNELKSDIPILAMTANALTSDKEDAYNSGMNDHISKPFYADDLVRTISRNLFQLNDNVEVKSVHTTDKEMGLLNIEEALSRLNNNEDLYSKTLKIYFHESKALLENLPSECPNDLNKVIIDIHSLKGISGTVGADLLAQHCFTLEVALKNNETEHYEILLGHIKEIYEKSVEALELEFGSDSESSINESIAKSEGDINNNLLALHSLLLSSNMKALDRYKGLRDEIELIREGSSKILDEYMQKLDFKNAASELEKMIDK